MSKIKKGSVEQLAGSPDCKSGSSDMGVQIPPLSQKFVQLSSGNDWEL